MAAFMKQETQSLFGELSYFIEIFNNESEDIGPYIEQSRALRKIQEEMGNPNNNGNLMSRTKNLEQMSEIMSQSQLTS
jgi:hypothetical protein